MNLNTDPPGEQRLIDDRYSVGVMLGSGGMGEVREGRDTKLGRPVAIKILRADLAAKPAFKQRFETEARAAASLSHPNIVAVFDTGEHKGIPFIVMELLSGRTVADELAASGPLEPERACRLAVEVLAALEASHSAGVLHRDIKPGNVLIAGDGTAKVADFGVAKIAEGLDMTQTGLMLGTPAYLPPERLAGKPAARGSDIYSVGVLLYELLSGRRPFDADTPLATAVAIQRGDYGPLEQLRPDLDPEIAAVVSKAMATNPEDRFSSAAEMAEAVTAALTGTFYDPAVDHATDPEMVVPGATEVLSVPRDRTQVLQRVPGETPVPSRARRRAPAPGSQTPIWVAAIVALVAIVAVLIFVNARNQAGTPLPTASSGASSGQLSASPLAPALEDSLKRLEDQVKP
jgi:eukaryotic-like serine/threonine-protein kinase